MLKSHDIIEQRSALNCIWTFVQANGTSALPTSGDTSNQRLWIDDIKRATLRAGAVHQLVKLLQQPELKAKAIVCLSQLTGFGASFLPLPII
jgi:hypothetical protein